MVTEQDPVPEQAPVHPESWYPEFGVATTATTVPAVYPPVGWVGLAERVPLVVPESVSEYLVVEVGTKFAVTLLLASMVTVQVPVPVQAPLHPLNMYPE